MASPTSSLSRRRAVALSLAGAAALGSPRGVLAQSRPAIPLKIGTAAGINPSIQPILYAQRKEIFQKHGLASELVHLNDSVTALQGLLAGACEILYTGAGTGMVAISRGADIRLICAHTPWTEFVFIAQEEIKSLKDLEGKSVGISRIGALNHQATVFVLRKEGVNVDKVQFVAAGNDSVRAQALVAKRVAGATINALDGHKALSAAPQLRMIYDVGAAFGESFMGTAVFARGDTMKAKPEAVQAAVTALIVACRELMSSIAVATEQAKNSGLDPAAVDAVFKTLFAAPVPYYGVDGGVRRATVESTLKILKETGELDTVPPYEKVVEDRYIRKALADLGAWKKP